MELHPALPCFNEDPDDVVGGVSTLADVCEDVSEIDRSVCWLEMFIVEEKLQLRRTGWFLTSLRDLDTEF